MSYWFRFYDEVLNDVKVQNLPPEIFKIFVNCLCAASIRNEGGKIGTIQDVSFTIRETISSVSSAFHALSSCGIIATVDETFHIKNWNKRQYKSDLSTDRVRKHRKRFRNVTGTASEADSERKEITKENPALNYTAGFMTFWGLYPPQRRSDKPKAFSEWKTALKKSEADTIVNGLRRYLTSKEVQQGFAPYPAKWLKGERWNEEFETPKQGYSL